MSNTCKPYHKPNDGKLDSMCWSSDWHRTGGWHLKTPLGSHEMGASTAAARCFQRAHTIRMDLVGVSSTKCPFWPWWRWPLTLTFKFGRDFCTLHLTAKFHHPTFNRSEVIVLTKQTPLKTSTSLRNAMPVGNYRSLQSNCNNDLSNILTLASNINYCTSIVQILTKFT